MEIICGIDEAGRGPLIGNVVAGAVVLDVTRPIQGLNDSKKLSHNKREDLYLQILDSSLAWGVGQACATEIDQINILRATHQAMRRAVAGLLVTPEHVLIDGLPVHPFPIPQTALVKGDSLSFSIAAASIIAKVTRDRIMLKMDALYPEYAFARHKGYGTAIHLERLKIHGLSPIHRKTFSPVAKQIELL